MLAILGLLLDRHRAGSESVLPRKRDEEDPSPFPADCRGTFRLRFDGVR
jgi:hypothetical protein